MPIMTRVREDVPSIAVAAYLLEMDPDRLLEEAFAYLETLSDKVLMMFPKETPDEIVFYCCKAVVKKYLDGKQFSIEFDFDTEENSSEASSDNFSDDDWLPLPFVPYDI